ncbi:MAG: hypothetical protein HY903_10360 [Deltaproteobacteria bacterium]|nr:hypothetical protein [Deltaproteobacteria bacterium]
MAEFDLIDFPRTPQPKTPATARTRDEEIRRRAAILAHLGYPQAKAEARLKANLQWEYERLGKAAVLKRVATLVGEEYARAGVAAPERRKKR